MRANESVIIVVPCYNEEQRLPVDEFRTYAAAGASVEFLFVNDGSTDGTGRLLDALSREDPEHFAVLHLEGNRGKAEAVRRGLMASLNHSPRAIGYWDADLATPLREIPSLLHVLDERPEVEMVFAARVRLLGKTITRQVVRHYLGRLSATAISLALDVPIYDSQCGAKLFRCTRQTSELFSDPFVARWLFDVEIIARAITTRGRRAALAMIYEKPLESWTDVAGSKVSAMSYLHSLHDLWRIVRRYHPRSME